MRPWITFLFGVMIACSLASLITRDYYLTQLQVVTHQLKIETARHQKTKEDLKQILEDKVIQFIYRDAKHWSKNAKEVDVLVHMFSKVSPSDIYSSLYSKVDKDVIHGLNEEDINQKVKTIKDINDVYNLAHKVCKVQRRGFKKLEMYSSESLGDHIAKLSFLCLMLGDEEKLDIKKCLSMIIIHDIAEPYLNDITPHDGVDTTKKHALERQIIQKIFNSEYINSKKMVEIYDEYVSQESVEANFVKWLDRLDFYQEVCRMQNNNTANIKDLVDADNPVKLRMLKEIDVYLKQILLEMDDDVKYAILHLTEHIGDQFKDLDSDKLHTINFLY